MTVDPVPNPIWRRFVRFLDIDGRELGGEPQDEVDVGAALANGQSVQANVLDTSSPLAATKFTGQVATIHKLLSPLSVDEVGTIRCVGLNYKDHITEMKMAYPTVIETFLKPSSALLDPCDPIVLPASAPNAIDAEVELAVVLAKDAKNVSPCAAWDYVLGYTVANDLTCRDLQDSLSQYGFAKGFDGFCPLGPVLVAKNSLQKSPHSLSLRSTLDGCVLQNGTTADMLFRIPEIIAHCSRGRTLRRGTVLLTGTPSGIGHSKTPPAYLREGSTLRLWIEGIGSLANDVVRGE